MSNELTIKGMTARMNYYEQKQWHNSVEPSYASEHADHREHITVLRVWAFPLGWTDESVVPKHSHGPITWHCTHFYLIKAFLQKEAAKS